MEEKDPIEFIEKEKVVKFPINSEKKNMQNKKCDYKTLAIMTVYSNKTPKEIEEEEGKREEYRYVYNNKVIEFTEEVEKLSKTKISTVVRNMRKLSELDGALVNAHKNESGEIYYVVNYANDLGREYVTIEEDMLKFLIWSGNSNVIKVYVLLKYMCKNGERKITREYIAKQIGLSVKSSKNLDGISIITESLADSGFIKKRRVYTNKVKQEIYYSVTTHEEWVEFRKEKRKKQCTK